MVTIKEIAREVGVSSSTVSRVLNYDPTLSISAAKRQAIIETAEALNYSTPRNRNRPAGAPPLQGHRAERIALANFLRDAEELVDPYYIGVRLGIERRCQALKIEVVKVYHTDSLPEPSLLQNASGAIAVGRHSDAEIEWLRLHCRSLVFADFSSSVELVDSVESDLRYAMKRLLASLWNTGYRRIAFIGEREQLDNVLYPIVEKRRSAYVEWTKAAGVYDPAFCLEGSLRFEAGYELARQLLALDQPPDVLITANDNMAIGAYRAILEKGLRLPDDIGVVSFNDIPAAQFLSPPLSTVKIHAEHIGETAVDLLLEQIAGRDYVKKVLIATEMVWRDSCRAPSSG
jgi:LacI family transcriptional regulator